MGQGQAEAAATTEPPEAGEREEGKPQGTIGASKGWQRVGMMGEEGVWGDTMYTQQLNLRAARLGSNPEPCLAP